MQMQKNIQQQHKQRCKWLSVIAVARYLTLLCLLAVASPSFSQQANANTTLDASQYRLGADDEIAVNVFNEPDLSLAKTRVAANGAISMPLIGQVQVKGLTIDEVEAKITSLYLGDYLKKPDVTVAIVEYRQFYVNGEVGKPGGYSYREGMTIQRAVSLAGGFTERAARNKIKLMRENNINNVINVDLNTPVLPGDVITVEESFF